MTVADPTKINNNQDPNEPDPDLDVWGDAIDDAIKNQEETENATDLNLKTPDNKSQSGSPTSIPTIQPETPFDTFLSELDKRIERRSDLPYEAIYSYALINNMLAQAKGFNALKLTPDQIKELKERKESAEKVWFPNLSIRKEKQETYEEVFKKATKGAATEGVEIVRRHGYKNLPDVIDKSAKQTEKIIKDRKKNSSDNKKQEKQKKEETKRTNDNQNQPPKDTGRDYSKERIKSLSTVQDVNIDADGDSVQIQTDQGVKTFKMSDLDSQDPAEFANAYGLYTKLKLTEEVDPAIQGKINTALSQTEAKYGNSDTHELNDAIKNRASYIAHQIDDQIYDSVPIHQRPKNTKILGDRALSKQSEINRINKDIQEFSAERLSLITDKTKYDQYTESIRLLSEGKMNLSKEDADALIKSNLEAQEKLIRDKALFNTLQIDINQANADKYKTNNEREEIQNEIDTINNEKLLLFADRDKEQNYITGVTINKADDPVKRAERILESREEDFDEKVKKIGIKDSIKRIVMDEGILPKSKQDPTNAAAQLTMAEDLPSWMFIGDKRRARAEKFVKEHGHKPGEARLLANHLKNRVVDYVSEEIINDYVDNRIADSDRDSFKQNYWQNVNRSRKKDGRNILSATIRSGVRTSVDETDRRFMNLDNQSYRKRSYLSLKGAYGRVKKAKDDGKSAVLTLAWMIAKGIAGGITRLAISGAKLLIPKKLQPVIKEKYNKATEWGGDKYKSVKAKIGSIKTGVKNGWQSFTGSKAYKNTAKVINVGRGVASGVGHLMKGASTTGLLGTAAGYLIAPEFFAANPWASGLLFGGSTIVGAAKSYMSSAVNGMNLASNPNLSRFTGQQWLHKQRALMHVVNNPSQASNYINGNIGLPKGSVGREVIAEITDGTGKIDLKAVNALGKYRKLFSALRSIDTGLAGFTIAMAMGINPALSALIGVGAFGVKSLYHLGVNKIQWSLLSKLPNSIRLKALMNLPGGQALGVFFGAQTVTDQVNLINEARETGDWSKFRKSNTQGIWGIPLSGMFNLMQGIGFATGIRGLASWAARAFLGKAIPNPVAIATAVPSVIYLAGGMLGFWEVTLGTTLAVAAISIVSVVAAAAAGLFSSFSGPGAFFAAAGVATGVNALMSPFTNTIGGWIDNIISRIPGFGDNSSLNLMEFLGLYNLGKSMSQLLTPLTKFTQYSAMLSIVLALINGLPLLAKLSEDIAETAPPIEQTPSSGQAYNLNDNIDSYTTDIASNYYIPPVIFDCNEYEESEIVSNYDFKVEEVINLEREGETIRNIKGKNGDQEIIYKNLNSIDNQIVADFEIGARSYIGSCK